MRARRYYQDAYTTTFSTTITEKFIEGNRAAIVLDFTYFYPTSGGQPADRGWIDQIPVNDVTVREPDGAVLHWLPRTQAKGLTIGQTISGVVDWNRRLDHMQQHTGQHILSQAFIRLAEAETVGFHLSDNNVTIDLEMAEMDTAVLTSVEQLANQIIWQNRPITVQFVTRSAAKTLPIRKIPATNGDELRLVHIQDFDLTACGGTHVSQTGGVGLLKIIKTEKRGEKLRVEFACGGRALQDYGQKHEIISALTTTFTTGADQLTEAVVRLREEARETQRHLKKEQQERQRLAALQFLNEGDKLGDVTIVKQLFADQDQTDLKSLASQLTQHPGVIVLLGQVGTKTQFVFARSETAPGNMKLLLSTAFAALGQGGGGGSPIYAQGGGPAAAKETVQHALDEVYTAVIQHIPTHPESS